MFDVKHIGRLLRMDWPDATSLAREFASILTSKAAKEVVSPVSITVPEGQAGLSVGRSKAEAVSLSPAAESIRAARIADSAASFDRAAPIRSDVPGPREIKQAVEPPSPRPPDFPEPPSRQPVSIPGAPAGATYLRQRPSVQRRESQISSPQVQSGPSGQATRQDSSAPQAKFAKGYSNPVFEATGEVSFKGVAPVRFDVPFEVWNPKTDEYTPYDFDGTITRIPLEDSAQTSWWGQVISGKGDTYMCNILASPDPHEIPEDFVSVKIVNKIDAKEQIPTLTYIYPVTENSDGTQWYGMIPTWLTNGAT